VKTIRIGAGQGFWGNGSDGARQMVEKGNINYLCCDALAELTLAILRKGMDRNPKGGWVNEYTGLLYATLPTLKAKGIKLITNHGGLNPVGAMEEAKRVAEDLGITGLKIAVVTGDNVIDTLEQFHQNKVELKDMDTGFDYATVKDRVMFANAYIGAGKIVEALDSGADIIITGRAADSALFLAPMIYEFGWQWDNWNNLAAGTLVGHLLECACQPVGGNFSGNWQDIPDMENIGYPLVEISENGEFIITKPEGTGGLVNVATVSEQLIYETLDPHNYIAPDVIVDFTSPQLTDLGDNRVKITNVKGKERPQTLKVHIGYQDGYAGSSVSAFSWPDAMDKAKKLEQLVRYKIKQHQLNISEIHTEYLGLNSIFGDGVVIPDQDSLNEVVVKLTARTTDKKTADTFSRLATPWALDGPPGNAGSAGFTGRARELLGSVSALVDRDLIEPDLNIFYTQI